MAAFLNGRKWDERMEPDFFRTRQFWACKRDVNASWLDSKRSHSPNPLRCANGTPGEQKALAGLVLGFGESTDTRRRNHSDRSRANTHAQANNNNNKKDDDRFSQVKPSKDLFRQSVLPRLHRADKKHRLSASCSHLRPLDEDHVYGTLDGCRESKRR